MLVKPGSVSLSQLVSKGFLLCVADRGRAFVGAQAGCAVRSKLLFDWGVRVRVLARLNPSALVKNIVIVEGDNEKI